MEIVNQEQLNRFLDAIVRLYSNWLPTRPLDYVVSTTYVEGILHGRIQQQFRHEGRITLQEAQDLLHAVQESTVLCDNDLATIRYMNAYFANASENLNIAFDIAVSGKPLPASPNHDVNPNKSRIR